MTTTSERTTTLSGGSSTCMTGDDPSQGGAVTITKQVTTITQSGQGPEAGSGESSTLQGDGSVNISNLQGDGSLSTQQEV